MKHTLSLLFVLVFSGALRAEIITLGNHRGDLGIWADFGINGSNNVWEVGQADADPTRSLGGAIIDTDAATVRYLDNSSYLVGREAIRNFSVPNGLNPDKQFQLRFTINESFYLYNQHTEATLGVTSIAQDRMTTDGVGAASFDPILFDLSGSYTLQGPTESVSGTFNLNDLTDTGSLLGQGGYPYGRFFRLARNGSGQIVDKANTFETYMYADWEFDFADQLMFDQMVDGEQMSFTLTSANYQHNTTFGSINTAVPEPSSASVIVSLLGVVSFLRRRA